MTETGKDTTADGILPKTQERTPARQATGADAAVIDALRRGDEEAFACLVHENQHALLRIARLYVSSPAIADEVVQDTWLAVIRGIWAFEGRSSLKTWILRILINRSKTRALREGRTVPFSAIGVGDPESAEAFVGASHQDDAGEGYDPDSGRWWEGRDRLETTLLDPALSPETRLLTEEARVRIRAAIDALPLNQRVVITMRDLEGCSSEEVCNTLGLSETNQRVILHRARSNVRTMLMGRIRKRR